MASKSKKPSGSLQNKGFGTPNVAKTAPIKQLRHADALVQKKKWAEAKIFLQSLQQTYPHDREVLVMLVNVCLDTGDMVGYGKACAQLLRVDPHNADVAYALAGAYMSNGHPLLTMQALRTAAEKFPDHEKAAQTQGTIAKLQPTVDKMMSDMELVGEAGIQIGLLHEQGQVYLTQGDLDLAEQSELEALRLCPTLVSARNNLSLIRWQQGNCDGAIATAHQVLAQEADNIHALSNLIHFHYLKGEFELAAPLGDRLKASQGNAWDGWTKKAEGLSYLRDDAGVLEILAQAQAAGDADAASNSPMFLHLVAVAMARLGQTSAAKQQWQKLLKKNPNYDLAVANLADLNHPIGHRQGAWPFPLNSWFDPQIVPELIQTFQSLKNPKDDGQIARATEQYLAKHPYVVKLLPILLERGDLIAREFAIHIANISKAPEVLEALKEFAFGQWGTDEMRHKAAMKLLQVKYLTDKKVRLWLKGEWQELLLIAYEFHDEPTVAHSRAVEVLQERAIGLLRQHHKADAHKAEDVLQQALKLAPDAPDLQQNLAVAYMIQGREAEAQTLIRHIAAQHPDYLFAQVSVARMHIAEKDLAAAEAILKPMLARERFSFSEFSEFSDGYILLLFAQKNFNAADAWSKMWEGVDPDHPQLKRWQLNLKVANAGKTFGQMMPKIPKRQG